MKKIVLSLSILLVFFSCPSPVPTIDTAIVSDPVFSPAHGSIGSDEEITLFCSTEGASIRYTLDGTVPTRTEGLAYTGPFTLEQSSRVMAIAYLDGWEDSSLVVMDYVIDGIIFDPVITPAGGTITASHLISLSCLTPGVSLRYTLDDSSPSSTEGILYTEPFSLDSTAVVRVIAYREGYEPSSIVSAYLNVEGSIAFPEFSPAGGFFPEEQDITLSSSAPGSQIRYTIDGSNPTNTSGILYSGPISVTADTTIRAIAYITGRGHSVVITETYRITGTVADPVITPAGGDFSSEQTIQINTSTAGAQIRYTTNGNTPTPNSGTVYTGPFLLSSDVILKAVAYQTGWDTSSVTSETFTITGTVAEPVIEPAGGTITSHQSISISCSTQGAAIRYTVNGSTPTETSDLYTGPFTIDSDSIVQARAFRSGWTESPLAQQSFTVVETVATPVITPDSGTYTGSQTIQITCSTPGAEIYYTMDNSDPGSSHGTRYIGTFLLNSSASLRVIAIQSGWADSPIVQNDYTITGTVATPDISPAGGIYTSAQTVTLSCNTPGVTIRYTTNGTVPDETTGDIYTGPFTVSEDSLVQAYALRSDWIDSPVASESYSITGTVEDPVFTPLAGTYTSGQTVRLSTTTEDALIRYTINGTEPTLLNGEDYLDTIAVDSSTTIRAAAFKNEWAPSNTVTNIYTITGQVETPVIDLASGNYVGDQIVVITCATAGASIYYTLDGSTPDETDNLFSTSITLESSAELRAVAILSDWLDSEEAAGSYVIVPKVAPVVIGPQAGGTFTNSQTVTLTSDTSGATIYYTLDGNDPVPGVAAIYSGSLTLTESATLKTFATAPGWDDSEITEANFIITGTVADPFFNPSAGTYNTPQNVTIICTTANSEIRYTIDGPDPTSVTGTVYTTPIALNGGATLRAIAYRNDWIDSSVITANYNFVAEAPVLTPPGGIYTTGQAVIMATPTDGASIYYTIDGSTPDIATAIEYTGPVSISSDRNIRAISVKTDWDNSNEAVESYIITGTVPDPVISPDGGIFYGSSSISLSCSMAEASIRYTTNGTDPTESTGLVYSSAFNISDDTDLRVLAYRTDWDSSQVVTAQFTLGGGIDVIPESDTYSVSITDFPSEIITDTVVNFSVLPSHSTDIGGGIKCYLDGVLDLSTDSSTIELDLSSLAPGNHNLTVVAVTNGVYYSTTQEFKLASFFVLEQMDFEDQLFPDSYDSSDSNSWTIEAGGTTGSSYCLQSASIGSNETSTALFNISPAEGSTEIVVNFDKRYSTQAASDTLSFWVNSSKISPDWSGELDWTHDEFRIPVSGAGDIQLEWRYSKDGSGTGNSDTVWIDNIDIRLQ